MKINAEKLVAEILKDDRDLGLRCEQSEFYIGRTDRGNLIYVGVRVSDEYDDDPTILDCMDSEKANEPTA